MANSGVSMCRSSWENLVYEIFPSSLFILLWQFVKGEVNGCRAVVFFSAASSFFQSSSQHPFVLQLSFFSKHFVKVVQPYNTTDLAIACKNSQWFLSERSDFYMINTLSIVVHSFPYANIALLPRYVSLFTILRGLPYNGSILFKTHEYCFIWVCAEANISYCLVQAMHQRFTRARSSAWSASVIL